MNNHLINEQEIYDQWSPILENKIGVIDEYKKHWLSKYVHYHSLHESALFENFAYSTTSTLGSIPGMGPVKTPSSPGGPLSFYSGATGSGDKFPSLLPLAIQVAAKTIGFDIVNVIPMAGPTGVLTYLDYVYGGGKVGSTTKPLAIKLDVDDIDDTKYTVGNHYWGVNTAGDYVNGTKGVDLVFVGYSFIDGTAIFRVGETKTYNGAAWVTSTLALSEIFNGSATLVLNDDGDPAVIGLDNNVSVLTKAELVKALEDHIQGYAGSGTFDQDNWTGNYVDGNNPANPMGRGTGESTYYRVMNMQVYTKSVEAETYQVAANVTTEQIQDLNKQFGIDVLQMLENALVNDISQSINKHILSRAFALGWSNNAQFYKTTGITLNFTLDSSVSSDITVGSGLAPAYINKTGFQQGIMVNKYQSYGTFENLHTMQRRIMSKILAAGNIIHQRGKLGPANFVVTSLQIATALQDTAQFSFAPANNTINQNNGNMYPLGSVYGMTIYVDPNMSYDDTRILVGRKGEDSEPGLKYMPYLLAESIQTIAEGSMSPKIAVKSRYALVEAGHHPETQYYTIYLKTNGIQII